MALSPQEQTWVHLQESLRRKRLRQLANQTDRQFAAHKRTTRELPRLPDSPSEDPLRGSHYPVIPPLPYDRYNNDDEDLNLQSYNIAPDDNYDDLSLRSVTPPRQPIRAPRYDPWTNHNRWNASTKVSFERRGRPLMDEDWEMQPKVRHRPNRRGFGQGQQRRHVWHSPQLLDEDEVVDLEQEPSRVVQRNFRGYRTREMLYYLDHPTLASSFIHHFLKDLLQHDDILDVACEVLIEERARRRKSHNARSTRYPEVDKLTIRHSPTEGHRFWQEALDRPEIHKPVAAGIIFEVIREETEEVLAEGVEELVSDYFRTRIVATVTNEIVTDVVAEMAPFVFEESTFEVTMETIYEDLISDEINIVVGGVLAETFVMGKMPLNEAEEQKEIQQVSRVAENILLDATFLHHLMSIVMQNGQIFTSKKYMDSFLDDRLLVILLTQYCGIIENRRAAEECVPLKRLHEKVVTDMAVDTIANELIAQLDEDLADLDEDELN